MSSGSTSPVVRVGNAIALSIAIVLPIAWWLTLTVAGKGVIADEKDHHVYVQLLTQGRWPQDSPISVLPVFHLLAAGATVLPGASLPAVRLFSVAAAIVLVVLSAIFAARGGRACWGWIALLVVANPLVLPYCSLVYTDILALMLLIATVVLHARGSKWPAMVVLLLAFLVRQTSLIWLLYFVACDLIVARRASSWRDLIKRETLVALQPYIVCFLCMVIGTALGHALILNKHLSNTPRFSFAQVHTFLLVVSVLWLPLWIEHVAIAWRGWFGVAAMQARCWAGLAAAAGVAAIVFDNSHPWNSDPMYLRNQYLDRMVGSELLRTLASGVILLCAVGAIEMIRRSNDRARLLAFAAVCAAFIGIHWLIDPRYYVFPLTMINLLAVMSGRQAVTLIAWQGAMTVGGCAYILHYGVPHGGIW